MEVFRRLLKSDLHEIITVAKQSYDNPMFRSYVLDDVMASFDKNQRYKIELYGFFFNNKLVHFCGFAKSVGIGFAYELRLTTTLPHFRGMGYNSRSHERLMATIASRHRDEPIVVQIATKRPDIYIKQGFKETGHVSMYNFTHLLKLLHQRNVR